MVAPKLRFDGFDSDWTLDSIGAVISNKSKKYDPEKSEIDFPCIELEHLSQQTGEILGTVSAKDQKSIKNVFDENSVLFGKLRPYLRKFAKPEFQGVCSSEIWVLTSKKMQPNFLFQYVQTDGFSELTQIQAGSKMPRADWGSISNGEILFPIFEEQTKIASFLSSVDEKISQLTQKHQLFSQYKQGMMQKLFSQQIRFKADDGSEFEEWRKTKFSDQFTFKNTNSYSRALLAENGEIMNIHYGDIHTKYSMLFDVSKERIPFLSEEIDTTRISKDQFLQLGDLVIADASEDYKDIGKTIEVIYLNNSKVVAGLHTFVARPIQQFALGFNGYLMQTFAVREQIQKLATGISVLGISKTNLSKIAFDLPCLAEQTKIANFLSAIDQKIEVTEQQIEQAKQWKKGLLQQMFV